MHWKCREEEEEREQRSNLCSTQNDVFARARWTGMASESVACTRVPCEGEVNRAMQEFTRTRAALFFAKLSFVFIRGPATTDVMAIQASNASFGVGVNNDQVSALDPAPLLDGGAPELELLLPPRFEMALSVACGVSGRSVSVDVVPERFALRRRLSIFWHSGGFFVMATADSLLSARRSQSSLEMFTLAWRSFVQAMPACVVSKKPWGTSDRTGKEKPAT